MKQKTQSENWHYTAECKSLRTLENTGCAESLRYSYLIKTNDQKVSCKIITALKAFHLLDAIEKTYIYKHL